MFVAALLAPVAAALLVLAAPRRQVPGDVVRLVAALAVPLWVALLVRDGVEHAGRFAARPAGAAAACGVAVIVAATRPVERGPVDVGALVVAWAAITLGVTAGVGDPSTVPLALGVAVAAIAIAVATVLADRNGSLPVTLAALGAASVVAGFAVAGDAAAEFSAAAFGQSPVGTALAVVGVAVVLIAALDARGPTVLAVPALAVAAVVAPHAGTPAAVVVPAAIAAAAAAWFDRSGLAVALVAVAALAVFAPAGLLLAAAVVVVAAVPSSPALVTAVPGTAALALHATREPSVATVVAIAAAGVVALLLTAGRDLRPQPVPLASAAGSLVGAHLTLAAGSWTWAGDAGLGHWNRGAGVAAAAGLLAAVVAVLSDRVDLPVAAPVTTEPGLADPPWAAVAVRVALAGLGLALAALVRSSLRSV